MDRVEEQSAWSDVTGVNPPGQQNRVHLQHLQECKQCTKMEKCLKAVCGGSGRCELELCVQLQGWDLPGGTEVRWEVRAAVKALQERQAGTVRRWGCPFS